MYVAFDTVFNKRILLLLLLLETAPKTEPSAVHSSLRAAMTERMRCSELLTVLNRTTVTTAHGGSGDDLVDAGDHLRHYQVYRGMSPNSSNRLEVDLGLFSLSSFRGRDK